MSPIKLFSAAYLPLPLIYTLCRITYVGPLESDRDLQQSACIHLEVAG